jgi:hypothetical protein
MNISISNSEPLLGLDPAIWAAVIGGIVAILAAGVSAYVVVWQIGKQARAAIEQNRDNERLTLKVKIYEEIVRVCTQASDAHIEFASYVRLFRSGAQIAKSLRENGQAFIPPPARWPELARLMSAATSKTIEFVLFVERWGIIDRRLDVFKLAFNAALYDVNQTWNVYSPLAMRTMPAQNPQTGQLMPWDIPPPDALDALGEIGERLCNAVGELTAYTSDFQVEMQNLLLQELFGQGVANRQPLDPRLKVVTLDKADELVRYFNEQTAWGASVRDTQARVKAQLDARSGPP